MNGWKEPFYFKSIPIMNEKHLISFFTKNKEIVPFFFSCLRKNGFT